MFICDSDEALLVIVKNIKKLFCISLQCLQSFIPESYYFYNGLRVVTFFFCTYKTTYIRLYAIYTTVFFSVFVT